MMGAPPNVGPVWLLLPDDELAGALLPVAGVLVPCEPVVAPGVPLAASPGAGAGGVGPLVLVGRGVPVAGAVPVGGVPEDGEPAGVPVG